MFVLADIEWATNRQGRQSLTQLAAVLVDGRWRPLSRFSSLIKPENKSFEDWTQVCYNGAEPSDFSNAPDAHTVLRRFEKWLGKDTTLLFWYRGSCDVYASAHKQVLKKKCKRRRIPLLEHVIAVLENGWLRGKNPYQIAESEGFRDLGVEHSSVNDVGVLLKILQKTRLSQDKLSAPPKQARECVALNTPYQYDLTEKLLHKKGCERIVIEHEWQGFTTLETCLKRGYKPCRLCMAKEFSQAKRMRNLSLIEHAPYNYLYIDGSTVFHTRTCHTVFNTGKPIFGTTTYKGIVKTGRVPCKLCKPTPFEGEDVKDIQEPKPKPRPKQKNLSRVERALKRHAQVNEERERLLSRELTAQERQDVYTLTQPEFSFWSIAGCDTFHLRHCPRLVGRSHYRGFREFGQALHARLRPCKTCKPSAKFNTQLSIPFENKPRENESVEQLIALCEERGYAHEENDAYFFLATPVGEWRIYAQTKPVKVEHHNLVVGGDFHIQPRIFLSLHDTFAYIHKHDKALMQQIGFKR